MKKFNKTQKKYLELLLLFIIIFSAILLWNTFLIFPIKLIVVTLHEISHGLAAILTGGSVITLDIGLDLGGVCITENGNQIVIASSGYLGSFLFGCAIFYSSYNEKYGKWILLSIAIMTLLFVINKATNSTFILILILLLSILVIMYYFIPKVIFEYSIKSIGLISCMYVIVDIKEDLLSKSTITSDAIILENLTGINSNLLAIFWLIISLIGIVMLLRLGFKKGIS